MEKVRDYQFFMTLKDEQMFCEALRTYNPNIYFLDIKPSLDGDVDRRLVGDITTLDSEFFSIVNLDMISKEELSRCYKLRNGYYYFYQLGRGQMQFLRSLPDVNVENCLQQGRIADSYEADDDDEKVWKNKVIVCLKRLVKRYIGITSYLMGQERLPQNHSISWWRYRMPPRTMMVKVEIL